METSLAFLSKCLYVYHHKNAVILMDEYDMLKNGDVVGMQRVNNDQLDKTISFMDGAENFYHGFMAGLLAQSKKAKLSVYYGSYPQWVTAIVIFTDIF